ncbi:methyltransferase, FxLD system [Sphaerimonospora sp. CA-214678]|uniref:methyltransferase, FxLD system n=1 Tax=Sphaerimonospora sp. CA-214678 TaxID=3240029 RepID=UPI003D913D62
MTKTVDMSEDSDRAVEIRNALADKLRAEGMITSEVVERAFRTVPRHEFVPPGTPLEVAYNADDSVATKTDEHGVIISSVSAPFIQARMIEQARLGPGQSVLEIGSGGYNAALLAEVVGTTGRVISMDIDPEVTERARALLEATGYGDAVTVVQGDAEQGVPEAGPFDAVIVTVGAWDIPPAWLEQLADNGTLVVPLRMNGITRSIAFRREADHLVSTSAEVCGFVAMQGEGEHPERIFLLPDAQGRTVKLRFDDRAPEDPNLLDGVLATKRTELWSGVTIKNRVSFADLHLWFAGFLPGFCKLAVDEGTDLANERGTWFPFGVVRGDSFAYLAIRPALEGEGVEFGARAYGVHGTEAAIAMVEQIQAWDRQARSGPAPTFAFWPTGSDHTHLPQGTAVFPKTHGLVTISWPALG